jgi:rhamnogalacturonan endolyase
MSKKLLLSALLIVMTTGQMSAQNTPASQMEKLDRGVVAVKTSSGIFVSWRFLGTDNEDRTSFDLLKNGSLATTSSQNLYKTNLLVSGATTSDKFQVVTKVDGVAVDTSAAVTPSANCYLSVALDKPAATATASYSPNDCSVGDVDGDGKYEIILKWDPSNSKDNSQSGVTDNVYLDCYKLDGTKLWRVNLGPNIRAGAHYTQFLVYDFDGDGKAEMICKTAPGSIDGKGVYVNQAATDATIKAQDNALVYRTSNGYIMSGPEYLTVFNGETGAAIHTIWYNPNRAGTFNQVGTYPAKSFWGDDYANRSERYLAAVAYLDGQDKLPSAVMVRGYYTRAYLWAVDFDGKQLSTKWLHASTSSTSTMHYDSNWNVKGNAYPKNTAGLTDGSKTAYGNGNHNMSVADVDSDGCDEIIWGSCAIDHDGYLKYATGYGHGDAIHLSDLDPDRPGLEVFEVHEESTANYGWDVHDAATGEILHSGTGTGDNGRGMAAQLLSTQRGFLFSSSNDRQQRSAITGDVVSTKSMSLNFRIYWGSSLQDALLDGNIIDALTSATSGSRLATLYNLGPGGTCNSTKNTPNLSADILGDWREEVILWDGSDSAHLAIYPSTIATEYRMPTLMHDHTYRMGVAWQNGAYNQPPHLGYYLPDAMLPRLLNTNKEITVNLGDSVSYESKWRYAKIVMVTASILPDSTKKSYMMPDGWEKTVDFTNKNFQMKGKATAAGDYKVVVKLTGMGGEIVQDTLLIHSVAPTGISQTITDPQQQTVVTDSRIYDAGGRQMKSSYHGLSIIRQETDGKKIIVKKVLR